MLYQTWPLMNQSYFPDDSKILDLFSLKALETPSIVQFIHRNLAYLIVLLFSIYTVIKEANIKWNSGFLLGLFIKL